MADTLREVEGLERREVAALGNCQRKENKERQLSSWVVLGSKVHGEMAEWFMAAVLKTVVAKATGGSNPSLSAICRCSSIGRAAVL